MRTANRARSGRVFRGVLVTLVLGSVLAGCTRTGLFVVNTLARFDGYEVVKDIPYGPARLNTLSIYTPAAEQSGQSRDAQQPRPVVVFFYGGCWGGCQTFTKEHYAFVAQALTARGYVAVVVDYRRYPQVRFPAMMHDASRAVEWVHGHIADYGGDPADLFLMGHSSGAQMAALLTLNESYLSNATRRDLNGFIGLAGPYDFLPLTEAYQQALFGPPEQYPASQPINFVDGDEPPLLLLQGRADQAVAPANATSLRARVNKAGGRVETHLYPGMDHVDVISAVSIPKRSHNSILDDISGFIERHAGSS